MVDSLKCFGAQILIFPPNFKIRFIAIVPVDLASLILTAAASTKTCPGAVQWDPYVGLQILVVGVPRKPISFNVLMAGSPKSTNCGASVWTTLLNKFILKSKQRSSLEPWESSR